MKQEDLDIITKEWNETDPESKYILVYSDGRFNISYARYHYIELLNPYDLYGVYYENWTPEQVLEYEVPEGMEGYIYEKDLEGNVNLVAKIDKKQE